MKVTMNSRYEETIYMIHEQIPIATAQFTGLKEVDVTIAIIRDDEDMRK